LSEKKNVGDLFFFHQKR